MMLPPLNFPDMADMKSVVVDYMQSMYPGSRGTGGPVEVVNRCAQRCQAFAAAFDGLEDCTELEAWVFLAFINDVLSPNVGTLAEAGSVKTAAALESRLQ